MPRKKPPFRIRTVYLSDPDPEAKQRIREDLTARLRPRLSRDEVLEKLRCLRARRSRLSAAAYEDEREGIFVDARRDPKRFWVELGDAFDTYCQRARLRPFHRTVTARLRYIVSAGKVDFRSGRGCVGRRCGSFEAACMCYGASIG